MSASAPTTTKTECAACATLQTQVAYLQLTVDGWKHEADRWKQEATAMEKARNHYRTMLADNIYYDSCDDCELAWNEGVMHFVSCACGECRFCSECVDQNRERDVQHNTVCCARFSDDEEIEDEDAEDTLGTLRFDMMSFDGDAGSEEVHEDEDMNMTTPRQP